MRKISISLITVVIFTLGFLAASAQEEQARSIETLGDVRKIYFDKWKTSFANPARARRACGKNPDCDSDCRLSDEELQTKGKYFLYSLGQEFSDRRFEIADVAEEADAILTMNVVLKKDCRLLCKVVGGVSVDDINAELRTTDGRKLWSVSFFYSNKLREDSDNVRQQAGWLAERIAKSKNELSNAKKEKTAFTKQVERIQF